MPKKIPFKLVKRFNEVQSFNDWKKQQESSWVTDKSNLTHCTICNKADHRMRCVYAYCNNGKQVIIFII